MPLAPDAEPLAPLVEPLPAGIDAATAFRRLCRLPNLVWFDSARPHATLGRYSYLAAAPIHWCECGPPSVAPGREGGIRRRAGMARDDSGRDAPRDTPLANLAAKVATFREHRAAAVPGLPPFQGGAAGLLSYSLGRWLEVNDVPVADPFGAPAFAVGVYPTLVSFDHVAKQGWLVSHGWSNRPRREWNDVAAERLARFKHALLAGDANDFGPVEPGPRGATHLAPLDAPPEPYRPLAGRGGLSSNFTRDEYLAAVQRAIDFIHAGDVFQVNLAQRLVAPAADDPRRLYLRLREKNPAPFAGYFDAGDFQIASASPERFVQSLDGRVETRPIKGTRRRAGMPEADLFSGDELLANEKDRSENVMIVDLLRNDLSRVCTPESVRVTRLCGLEQYQFVQHLTSVIEGRLADGRGPLDLIHAAFPGGSITGAPKPRAMEIISELEGVARGAYCGSLFYLGHDGAFDSSILIRTVTAGRGWRQAHVGGGIVADSSPAAEYDETWHKAQGLAQTMLAEPRST